MFSTFFPFFPRVFSPPLLSSLAPVKDFSLFLFLQTFLSFQPPNASMKLIVPRRFSAPVRRSYLLGTIVFLSHVLYAAPLRSQYFTIISFSSGWSFLEQWHSLVIWYLRSPPFFFLKHALFPKPYEYLVSPFPSELLWTAPILCQLPDNYTLHYCSH